MNRHDRVLAWGVGVGEGLVAFMVCWIIAARLTPLAWSQPLAAQLAMGLAAVTGLTLTVVEVRRKAVQLRHN